MIWEAGGTVIVRDDSARPENDHQRPARKVVLHAARRTEEASVHRVGTSQSHHAIYRFPRYAHAYTQQYTGEPNRLGPRWPAHALTEELGGDAVEDGGNEDGNWMPKDEEGR